MPRPTSRDSPGPAMSIVFSGQTKRRRWQLPLALATLTAASCLGFYFNHADSPSSKETATPVLRAPSLLSVGSDAPPPQEPTAPQRSAVHSQPPPALRAESQDDKFMRLASSVNPRDLAAAYDLMRNCAMEARILEPPWSVQVHPLSSSKCTIAQGHWQDMLLRKKLLAAKVERAEFAAFMLVESESAEAFADDREAYKDLRRRAYKIGVENAEPTALGMASLLSLWNGESDREDGRIEDAKASFRQGLVYAAAAAINIARVTGRTAPDFSKEPNFPELAAKLDPRSVETAIEEGREYARRWNEDLVNRALGR